MSKSQRLEIEYVDPRSLVPAPYNPRILSGEAREALARSMDHWGVVDPIVVRRGDNEIIGGHQRVQVAIEQGLERVPVVMLDISPQEAKALNVALNRIHGDWDLAKLSGVLGELRDLPGMDMTLTGFSDDDLTELLTQLEAETRFVPPQETFDLAVALTVAQDPRAPTRCKEGDVWALGHHRLLCADTLAPGNLERLLEGSTVPIIVTDPPYGIDYQSTMTKLGAEKDRITHDESGRFPEFLERALPVVRAAMEPGAVLYWFAGGGGSKPVLGHVLLAITRHFDLQNCLVWDKETPGLGWRWRRSWEAIVEASIGSPAHWHGGTGRRNVLRYPKLIPSEGDHPTPKPVGLLAELLRAASPPRSTVLDPFCGSGSTLIAAEVTDRTCFAMELKPGYCDLILNRWESLTRAKAERVEVGENA